MRCLLNCLTKGALQSRELTGEHKNIVIGVILSVIALISCVAIALLLWYLSRQTPKLGHSSQQIDLLEEARLSEDSRSVESSKELIEKPLPPTPRTISADTFIEGQTVSPPFSTPADALPEHQRPPANKTKPAVASNDPNKLLTVFNVAESDLPRVQQGQSADQKPPSPPTYVSQVRGRVPPFPPNTARKARPRSIVVQEDAVKQQLPDAHFSPALGTGFSLSLPPPARLPTESSSHLHPRAPFTITTSRPISDIVVGETRRIRKPDGKHGKIVTMAITVDDSGPESSHTSARTSRRPSNGDNFSQLLDAYRRQSSDPPVYTPRQETSS